MKLLKKLFPVVTAVLLVTALLSCAGTAKPVEREVGKAYELVFLHTNDHHGSILPNNGQGGLAERATYVKGVRAANANVLVLDAGDVNIGPALSNMFYAEPDFKAYNLIGYDAATFGNHEFDGNMDKLNKQIALAKFPIISSNIKTKNGKFLGGRQYLVKNYDGFRVGIIGITTLRSLIIANPDKSLTFLPEIKAAQDAVDLLINKEKVDFIIALTHMGDRKEAEDHVISPELAAAVPGIAVIIDGHSHTKLEDPIKVGDTYIVSANEWGKFVGEGKLRIVDGKIANFAWKPVAIDGTYAPDAQVAAMIAPYKEKADASLKEVVGQASDTFIFGNRLTRYQETALGNMICDANTWYFRSNGQNIDFAFHNGGNIRAELPKGPLTREQILTVLPFKNYLYIASLKGSQIIELFNFIGTVAQGAGGFPQFSSDVRYTINIPAKTVSNLTIGGAPVDPNKTYRFCTNDYLLGGGDGYTILTQSQNQFNTSLLLSYVVIEYIASQKGIITPTLDGRMTVVGGVTP